MSKNTNQATVTTEDSTLGQVLYMAFELGDNNWKIAFSDGRPQHRVVTLPSRDLKRLSEEITKAKCRFKLSNDCEVVSCYEAGRDGFWLHRFLVKNDVQNVVVDSASIEVNRRRRRAKTDRLDARKLLFMLIRHHGGEPRVWSVVYIPSEEDEDARQLHRDLEQLKKEAQQHRNRITSLLIAQGVTLCVRKNFLQELRSVRLWNGKKLSTLLLERLKREYRRLRMVNEQVQSLQAQRKKLLKTSSCSRVAKVRDLQCLRGLGMEGSWLLIMEMFGWRQFYNRKEVGASAGLTGTPYDSGGSAHDQGISKAGNRRVRWMMCELSWCWLRFQPESALSQWFNERFGEGKRHRRKGIVALARRLLIAIWRYIE